MDVPNPRTQTFTTGSGKDVKDTQCLKGEAQIGSQRNESNTTKQYESGSATKGAGNLGGKASGK